MHMQCRVARTRSTPSCGWAQSLHGAAYENVTYVRRYNSGARGTARKSPQTDETRTAVALTAKCFTKQKYRQAMVTHTTVTEYNSTN